MRIRKDYCLIFVLVDVRQQVSFVLVENIKPISLNNS